MSLLYLQKLQNLGKPPLPSSTSLSMLAALLFVFLLQKFLASRSRARQRGKVADAATRATVAAVNAVETALGAEPLGESEIAPSIPKENAVSKGKTRAKSSGTPWDDQVCFYYRPGFTSVEGEPKATDASVQAAVKVARAAQTSWAARPMEDRIEFLRTLRAATVVAGPALSRLSSLSTGKTPLEAVLGDVVITLNKLSYLISQAPTLLADEYRSAGLLLCTYKRARVTYEPFGVIGIIVPWNYPIHNVLGHVVTALVAGNAVIVKVSEWSAAAVPPLLAFVRTVLREMSLPEELVEVVTGDAATGQAIIDHVDKVLFIGSPGVGKHVMSRASKTLTPVTLELGGKDPLVVTDVCDIDHAVDMAVRGAFINCGQNCIAAERMYVYESVYDKFVARATETVKSMRFGLDYGSMVMTGQYEKRGRLLADAKAKGATIVEGGDVADEARNIVPPTMVVNATADMEVVREEAFLPLMTIVKVPGDSDAEAVRLINESSVYGLACSVFCDDATRATFLTKNIRSGMACVNDFGLFYMAQALPFGGVGASGFGKFNGPEGLRDFCVLRTFVEPAWLGKLVSIRPPPPMRYPVSETIADHVMKLIKFLG